MPLFPTPPRKMVNTRSTAKKEEERLSQLGHLEKEQTRTVQVEASKRKEQCKSDAEIQKTTQMTLDKSYFLNVGTSRSVKSENVLAHPSTSVPQKVDVEVKSAPKPRSKASASSSVLARRKKLELEAAQEKARIQMELIDKKLAADMAELDENYSSRTSERSEVTKHSQVEKWIDRSQQELKGQSSPRPGNNTGKACPPLQPVPGDDAGHEASVSLLVSAIKDLTAATASAATKGSDVKMLSRLCTPRDLPTFSGDPLEWLQFKQAYQESTLVCNFNEKENLWRLRKCLHGPAKEAVTSLLISATSPDIIMSTLDLQFGNPDVIISKIMQDITSLQPLPEQYHKGIIPFSVKVKNYVAAVLAIGQNEYLSAMNIVSVILSKLPTILISKWADFSYPYYNQGCKSKLVILSEFLDGEAVKISRTAVNITYDHSSEQSVTRKNNNNIQNRTQAILVQSDNENDDKCRFCRFSKHKLPDCRKFKKSLRKDRWFFVKRNRLCYKCLVSNHNREDCPAPVCDNNNCGKSHHRLLHYSKDNNSVQQNSVNVTQDQDAKDAKSEDSEAQVETVSHIKVNSSKVLLKTVPVNIHGPNGIVSCVALLDDGSTVSLISAALSARVGVHGHKQTMRVCGAWDSTELVCESEIVDLNVSNKDGTMFTFQARSVNKLDLPVQSLTPTKITNMKCFPEIKKYLCDGHVKPELLIGQDNYHLMLPTKIVNGAPGELYATHTPLGWCVHGRVMDPQGAAVNRGGALHSTLLISEDAGAMTSDSDRCLHDLQEEVRRSFAIESMGIGCKPRKNADDERAVEHLDRTSSLIDGRWYVGLPWKNTDCNMPESYPTAETRLRGVMRKMKADEGYSQRYKDRIDHLFENDYATEITDPETKPKTWYLPHFGVDNPNKKKLRLVFDAAAKSNGFCLNDYFLTGPDLLVSLFGIMLRFREHRIAVSGDIRDMFLRVKIIPEDRNVFRFLWRPTLDGEIKTYVMTSLIFGGNFSPFIAIYVKNKNAQRYESSMPAAVEAIWKQHYVDDYLDSLESEDTAIKMVTDITHIHKQGGFDIRNWTCNNEAVINSLPKETLGPTAIRFKVGQNYDGERTLGLIWFPQEDTLGFDLSLKRIPEKLVTGERRPTKREMLRVIMSIFDVYGFLAPFTIKGKIILQETWKTNLSWDEMITDNLFVKWIEWLEMLKRVSHIRMPRYYHKAAARSETEDALSATAPDNASGRRTTPPSSSTGVCAGGISSYSNLQLHMFCDASTKAMCAVAYWRWKDNGRIRIAFISSKCRVAPIKHISVPRLELQAAVLASRLSETIIKEHRIKVEKVYFWCDSATVLHWIRNNTRTYKVYIAHRLGEIDEFTQTNDWRYIPSKLNVADIATREYCDISVLENEWFRGPEFLNGDERTWPQEVQPPCLSDVDLECVATLHVTPETDLPAVPDPERFSSWLRLLKSTCKVLSFIDKCKKLTGEINGEMMMKTERLLIRYSQVQSFPEDLANLKQKKELSKRSKLLTLSPFLDEYGVLRVGGRINAAPDISQEVKQPVILDGRHHVTMLIVRHYHIKAAHGNQELVVNELKQKFWIIRIRPTVKTVTSKCMLCRIRKAMPAPPRMGDLPKARMAHHQRPFTFCGVDLFGPMEVSVCRRREKRYGVLFTCLTVRAIHIEIVTKLTTDVLIMALRRMAARRGWPQHLFSDNGTNLKGSDTELRKSVLELNEDVLKNEAVNYGTTWTFIPPASPHWGGAWERLIRSVKTSLHSTLKERAPRDEVLSTLMAEVEQMVNSRPLTHVTVEPNTYESLTPNHFLLGTSSNLPIIGEFGECDMSLRKQWRMSQHLADLYWKRWVKEVLPEMRPRTKWLHEERPLQVGDVVLIVDPNSPRNVWPKGLVQAVMPGKDGRTRVVDIKTKSGVFRRTAARVARIPMGDEC